MTRKSILALLLALVLAFSLIGCSSGAETPPAESETEAEAPAEEPADEPAPEPEPAAEEDGDEVAAEDSGDSYKIYLITMDLMDTHWVSVDEGCRAAVAELGANIEYIWDGPTDGKNDVAQMECINNAVANGADLILLASNGPDTQVAAIEEAASKGTKFIYVDSPANYDGAFQTLATDNTAAGKTAGEEMIKALEAKGITSGDIGVVSVNAATASTVQRETGFRSAFEGTEFNVLETQYGEGQIAASQDIALSYITSDVVGIFGTNEGSTTGVGNAILESNSEIVGVGFDQSDAIKQLINDGALLCTMAQNPYVMGYEGIKSAYTVLTGGTLSETSLDTGVSVIDIDALS